MPNNRSITDEELAELEGRCASARWRNLRTDICTPNELLSLIAEVRRGRAARDALREVMEWISNWSPNFVEDDAWPATKAKARVAMEGKDNVE